MKTDPIDLAIRMAHKGIGKFRLGAVLTKRNRVISTGSNNMRKSHPKMKAHFDKLGWWVGIHAEVDACLGVPKSDLEGATIYVGRIRKDGTVALAKPCKFCQRFLSGVGVTEVHYTTGEDVEVMSLL